jgi:hypothetical protein
MNIHCAGLLFCLWNDKIDLTFLDKPLIYYFQK